MKKTTLSLLVAGALATAGIAQAQSYTYDTPQQAGEASTMSMGAPNLETTTGAQASVDTRVLGAPSTILVPVETYTAVQPGWSGSYQQRHQAAATFNTPARAGEASTMTHGNPNQLTDNSRLSADTHVQVYSVPNF